MIRKGAIGLRGRLSWLRTRPYAVCSSGVFVVAAYLCLVNLDYVSLWHDEALVFTYARNLIEQGDIVGWDGRNLVGGPNGQSLNDDLRPMGPPLQYLVTAAGFALFGFNELGARFFHALAGVLALALFFGVLRQQIPDHPRVTLFIFLFVAWSAQLLLYFRQARYYSVSVLCMVAAFYLYEHYWQTKRPVYLAILTGIALVAVLNHYVAGTATMLALGVWHLLCRARATAVREWVAFAVAGMLTALGAIIWLVSIEIIGTDRNVIAGFRTQDFGPGPDVLTLLLLKLWICFRDLFGADWISWPVFLWFVGIALAPAIGRRTNLAADHVPMEGTACSEVSESGVQVDFRRRGDAANSGVVETRQPASCGVPLTAVYRMLLVGALCAMFTTLLSIQPVWVPNVPLDFRYFVPALPLLVTMKGLFIEWLWRRSRVSGVIALLALLFTSVGAAPFNAYNVNTQRTTLGAHLPEFVREIHAPDYRNSISVVSDYLLRHAKQDDLVEVPRFADREALTAYVGGHVRFCHVLDEKSPLPRQRLEALAPHLYRGRCVPDWIVLFGRVPKEDWGEILADYEVAAQPDVYYYPTQRPEIIWHAFKPLTSRGPFLHILRRRGIRP